MIEKMVKSDNLLTNITAFSPPASQQRQISNLNNIFNQSVKKQKE